MQTTLNGTARITKDHLGFDKKGTTFKWGEGCVVTEHRRRFSLIDDDGICYYEGFVKAEDQDQLERALEYIWLWGAADSGTTVLRVDGEDYIPSPYESIHWPVNG